MSGKPVVIGPFIGGLNNVSKAGEAEDAQVVELMNFEVTPDKALTSRPPMQIINGSNQVGATKTWDVLGIYRLTNDSWYVIVQKAVGLNWSVGHMLLGDATTYTEIKAITGEGNKVTAMVQVEDTLYFAVGLGSSINGFYWKLGGVLTDTPTMPKGYAMVAFKSRIWLAGQDSATNGSTLWFTTIDASGILKYDTWTTETDFIKVAPGEGGNITALLALNNSILIFKNDGTWRFSYPSKPAQGQIDRISGTIGAAGPQCVVEFENYVYLYDQGKVYELVSNVFSQINRTVKFEADTGGVDATNTYGADLSVVSRRLVLRYYNTIFSYHLDTRAWSQWRSNIGTPGKFWELPADSNSSVASKYVAASEGLTQNTTGNLLTAEKMNANYMLSLEPGGNFTIETTATSIKTTCINTAFLELYLNGSEGTTNFDMPIGGGYKINVKGSNTLSFRINVIFKLKNGTTSTVFSDVATTGAFDVTLTSPVDAIQCYVTFSKSMTAGQILDLTGLTIARATGQAPVNLLIMQDDYITSSSAVEYIECVIRTKSYDYQAPTVRKRLFWWAIDAKTNQSMRTRTIPIAKAMSVTHAELAAYTHAQLSFGTWGNPLSFLNPTLIIIDSQDLANSATENGRILAKNYKGLRFRQISFEVTMKTFGDTGTGPCKLFQITSYVLPKEKVSSEVS